MKTTSTWFFGFDCDKEVKNLKKNLIFVFHMLIIKPSNMNFAVRLRVGREVLLVLRYEQRPSKLAAAPF